MDVPKITIKKGIISSSIPIQVETDGRFKEGKNVTILRDYCKCEKPFPINGYCVNKDCYKEIR